MELGHLLIRSCLTHLEVSFIGLPWFLSPIGLLYVL
jgi:hypothetical protein